MGNKSENPLNINVTKIVKYVCLAGVLIVAIIFGERAYTAHVCSKECKSNE